MKNDLASLLIFIVMKGEDRIDMDVYCVWSSAGDRASDRFTKHENP